MSKHDIRGKFLSGIRVENMTTPTGGDAPNQFIINTPDAEIFQSYRSIVAIRVKDPEAGEPEVFLGRNWDYSNTTMKYLKQFLGHGAAETRKKIESGEYDYEESLA